MAKESDTRQWLVKLLRKNGAHAMAVDNESCYPGTPDVNYCFKGIYRGHTEGWIEIKRLESWPARPSTVVRIPHFSPQQRIWLQQRTAAGGVCFILLHVGRQKILLHAAFAAGHIGKDWTRDDILAHRVGLHDFTDAALVAVLLE